MCLSVCPSQVGTVPKRLNNATQYPRDMFSVGKDLIENEIPTGSPPTRASNIWGRLKWSIFYKYLAVSQKMVQDRDIVTMEC